MLDITLLSWSKYLTTAEIAYNNLTHSTTGMSPFYLVYQRHANFPLDFACSDLEAKNTTVESLLNSRQKLLSLVRDHLSQSTQIHGQTQYSQDTSSYPSKSTTSFSSTKPPSRKIIPSPTSTNSMIDGMAPMKSSASSMKMHMP